MRQRSKVRPGRSVAMGVLGVGLVLALLAPAPGAGANGAGPRCDINGDGYGELFFLNPEATVDGKTNAGELTIRFGSSSGLPAKPDKRITQNTSGIMEKAGNNDGFASALACGDFDEDGFDDLAIGVPGEHLANPIVKDAGAVNVIYGKAGGGLDKSRDEVWHQNSTGIKDKAQKNDHFGTALVAGDFDGDGHDDLAIGVPDENLKNPGVSNGGAVNVIYGSNSGLDSGPDDLWHQNKNGVKDVAETEDRFGASLASGDIDGDGRDDLIVRVFKESINGAANAGALNILFGTSSGLGAGPDEFWHQDKSGIKEQAEENDFLGAWLTIGDFNGDGHDDIALGLPNESRSANGDGIAQVIYGSPSGLDAGSDELWHQDRPGVKDQSEEADIFGAGLTGADFNGDGIDDLAVAAPGENLTNPNVGNAGAVNVLYGTNNGLDAGPDDFWHQNKAGVLSAAADNEFLGTVLTSNDYNGDGYFELVMSEKQPVENGNVLYGGAGGLSAAGDQFIRFP